MYWSLKSSGLYRLTCQYKWNARALLTRKKRFSGIFTLNFKKRVVITKLINYLDYEKLTKRLARI